MSKSLDFVRRTATVNTWENGKGTKEGRFCHTYELEDIPQPYQVRARLGRQDAKRNGWYQEGMNQQVKDYRTSGNKNRI